MISELEPYPSMKESAVPWVGLVPEHWTSKPLKRLVKINAAVLPETTSPDFEFKYLDIGSVGTGHLIHRTPKASFQRGSFTCKEDNSFW
jgi:type I restriction enzyme S subunit